MIPDLFQVVSSSETIELSFGTFKPSVAGFGFLGRERYCWSEVIENREIPSLPRSGRSEQRRGHGRFAGEGPSAQGERMKDEG